MTSLSKGTFIVELLDCIHAPLRATRHVVIHAEVLRAMKVHAGDVIAVISATCTEPMKYFAVGLVWPSFDLPHNSVRIASSLLLSAHVAEGAAVNVIPFSQLPSASSPHGIPPIEQAQHAEILHAKEVQPDNHEQLISHRPSSSDEKGRKWLVLMLKETLVYLKYITSSQFVQLRFEGRVRVFSISVVWDEGESQNPSLSTVSFKPSLIEPSPILYTVDWTSQVVVVDGHVESGSQVKDKFNDLPSLSAYEGVGGLTKEIAQIRDLLDIPLQRPELLRRFGLKPPKGILLHGPPGTGKTHLARAIASSTAASVLVINGPELSSAYHGETESKLREVFQRARDQSPSIVILDEIDALVPKREDHTGGEVEKRVVATLLTILDGMEDAHHSRVVVVGTTNRLNAIDPALRRPGRFDREIEVGIPDVDARFSILKIMLSKIPHSISDQDLRAISARLHGYVGADISAVVREAGILAIKRHLQGDVSSTQEPILHFADLLAALPSIRPTAMRPLFLDTPPVRYADIGGQAHAIQKLREAVEWPLLYPDSFRQLGVKPPKGVLLYGPPGCSKTILARACAWESGINFIPIRGPELLSKFLGQSERALREVFSKARAVSPSIVFFDEIDALGTSRTSTNSEAASSSHEGTLITLLNEMDGVQELVGVTIIAATNRPDVMDPALIRPGRLDRIVYVGPPDQAGREEILRIRLRSMSVSPEVDIEDIARITEGYSGAELVSLCQEAAMLTMRKDLHALCIPHGAFVSAAQQTRPQITREMIQRFVRWRAGLPMTEA